ncbi:hypothetical protein LMG24238_07619 [Paraburkholderia sediminicola]|uniref:Nucleoside phosphorylase domain-containing protein n=1 Tax=Paraburkholderia sediminicola TaxID=458836 RepID=A0A6J5CTL1_9BURK|nr:hypothetical protein [Paraburkholderia sediminicola]CAB3745483.1 hypothetical protein LMG24238_07619 [Paraburkholderia sediminicola]
MEIYDLPRFKAALQNNFIFILTSNSKEKGAVNEIIKYRKSVPCAFPSHGLYIGFLGDRPVVHLSGTSGISEKDSISRIATQFLSDSNLPSPCLVILVGFCWGRPDLTKIGDVLVSREILSLNYSISAAKASKRRPSPFKSSLLFSDELQEELVKTEAARRDIVVHCGPLASLETLLTDDVARNEILEYRMDTVGGEMEAFGFVPSCQLPWIVVKAVSDFGDSDFSRKSQADAARAAASFIEPLTDILVKFDALPAPRRTSEVAALEDLLVGATLRIEVDDQILINLNTFLNDIIGPRVDFKLSQYCSAHEYGSSFARHFCDLLLEVTQNSILHGKSKFVDLKFSAEKIEIIDEGGEFDLENLPHQSNGRGGTKAWQRTLDEYISKNLIEYKFIRRKNINQYTFSLIKSLAILIEAKKHCTASFTPDAFNIIMPSKDVFVFDEKCSGVYINVSSIRMSSRRIRIFNAVKELLDEGKYVLIACNDQKEVEELAEELIGLKGENLKIFVDSDIVG